MKVAPATALPFPLANPAADAPSDPTVSFEALLDEGAPLKAEQPQRALGFSERGLLVSWGVEPGLDTSAEPSAQASTQTVAPTLGSELEKFTDRAESARMMFEVVDAPAPHLSEPASSAPRATSVLRGSGPQDAQAAPGIIRSQPQAASRQVGPPEPQRTAPPMRQAPSAESRRLSLVISEQNGVVQIIAGAPELSPDARTRLRKAAAALAAEFGVTLSEFTVNGVSYDPALSSIGAPHGDFAG